MTGQTGDTALPLDDVMMAMDVVDTLRHRQDLVERELSAPDRDATLIEKLRDIYNEQGIEVPDRILEEGVAALKQDRFAYTPPAPGFGHTLALLYVSRDGWGKWALGIGAVLVLALGAYFLAYLPYRQAQVEAARVELTQTMPADMQALYNNIFEETKVQTAVAEAESWLTRGKAAISDGDRVGAQQAIDHLSMIRDQLRQVFTLKVVNRAGEQSGFWTIPDVNQDATNYYIVVEALDEDGNALTLPVTNEETGETEEVDHWGLRVPESVYNSVAEDKQDDGIIENNVVGSKEFGFLETDYTIPALGGTVTRW